VDVTRFAGSSCGRSLALSRHGPFPPVDGLIVGGHLIDEVSDDLDVRSPAAGPTELPEFAGSSLIVVERLVNGVGVDISAAGLNDRIAIGAHQEEEFDS